MNPKFSMVFIWLLEAAIGIEPMDKGFADLCLTTWLRRPKGCQTRRRRHLSNFPASRCRLRLETLERETGFEPATSTLARSHSTAELLPLRKCYISQPGAILSTTGRRIRTPAQATLSSSQRRLRSESDSNRGAA